MDTPISVVIADDHPLYLKALSNILKTFPQVGEVYQAADGKMALELVKQQKPTLAIFDLNMPFFSGLQVAERLLFEFPETMIIILSMRQDLPVVRQAVQLGVLGCLPKESEIEEIEEAIQTVLKSQVYFPLKLAQRLALDRMKKPQEGSFTDREWHAIQLMSRQFSAAKIAEELSISVPAAERLKSHILYKICANSGSAGSHGSEWAGLRSGIVT